MCLLEISGSQSNVPAVSPDVEDNARLRLSPLALKVSDCLARDSRNQQGETPVTISSLAQHGKRDRSTSFLTTDYCSSAHQRALLSSKRMASASHFGLEWNQNHEPRERTRRSTEARKGEHGRTPGRVHRHFISSLPHERGGREKGQKTARAKMTAC
jgi:hypothetical protein